MAFVGDMGVEVIYRADAAAGPQYWANRYEVSSSISSTADAQSVGLAYAQFSRRLLMPNFWLDRVVVSSLAADSEPYNPEVFSVIPVNARGTRAADGAPQPNVLPLFTCLLLRKVVTTGRLGHVFLRGMLTENDIQSDLLSGAVGLSAPSAITQEVATAFTELLSTLGTGGAMSMISGTGLLAPRREVTALLPVRLASRGMRTTRKSRLVQSAATTLGEVLSDGAIEPAEWPKLIEAGTRILGYLGAPVPSLPG